MGYRFFFLLCLCCTTSKDFAINIDSLLLIKDIKITKPYLIINVTSTECITCRAGSANILNKLSDSQLKEKIIILSDDKNMSLYFRRNEHIYNGYKTIYNKELSDALALGPSATACLFQTSGEQRFLLNKVNNDTINYFKKILAGGNQAPAGYIRFKVKDSIFSSPADLSFDGGKAILFNSQFQIALQFDMIKNTVAYMQPEYNDSTVEVLDHIISPWIKNLVDVKYAREELRNMGVDQITIHGLNLNSNSVLFKQYAVSMIISNNFNDTSTFSLPQLFVAKKDRSRDNLFDLKQGNTFFPIDQMYYLGDTLDPLFSYSYQVRDNNLFIPYWDIRHSKSNNVNGRVIKETTCMYIVEYRDYEKGNKSDREILKVYDTANGPGAFFLRVNSDNEPVIISASTQTITFLRKNTRLNFSDFIINDGEFVKKVFDVSFTNDTIWFAAVTNKNNCIKGYRLLNTNKTKVEKLPAGLMYQSMRISGNYLLGYKRSEESEELIFDRYSFQ